MGRAAHSIRSDIRVAVLVSNDIGAVLGELRDTHERASSRTDDFENLSHELRTPLSGIIGSLDLLANSGLNNAQLDLVATISDSADRLLAAVDLLAEGTSINDRLSALIADAKQVMGLLEAQAASPGHAPPAAAPVPATPIAAESGTADESVLRVLVAEDNTTNQLVVRSLLERMGHECTVVENGQLAVDAVQEQTFDVILMDCMMPVLDGFGATRGIRALESGADIPILALTANAMKGDRERCLEAGMTEYMSKPVRLDVLTDMLERFASRRPD